LRKNSSGDIKILGRQKEEEETERKDMRRGNGV
jgi:hypothetical protein